jgi:hypothetical protein
MSKVGPLISKLTVFKHSIASLERLPSMIKALVDQLIKKDKDRTAAEQELAKDIDSLPKEQGFLSIGFEYASRISSLVPMMKTETVKAIIAKFLETYAQESLILLASIECGRIGVEEAEVISRFIG